MTILTNQEYIRCSKYTSFAATDPALAPHEPPARIIHVRLKQLPTGCWSVQDTADGRGGLFRDYAAAAKFIRHEFITPQPTIVEVLQATSDIVI
jgi:hypothetical protein